MDIDSLQVINENGYNKIVTLRPFRRGQVICALPCTAMHPQPSRYTVQVSPETHVNVGFFLSLNHSCDPNVTLDTENMLVITWRDIPAGEEITYFYPSTEWDMAAPFICNCGSPDCLKFVQGAKYLPPEALDKYPLNRHILEMMNSLYKLDLEQKAHLTLVPLPVRVGKPSKRRSSANGRSSSGPR